MDLKPCPCCGHRAELREDRYDYGVVWSIECRYCGLMIDGGAGVIDAWNSRCTDGMIAWLDAEIRKCEKSETYTLLGCRFALHQCKKQLLKLLDGVGIK